MSGQVSWRKPWLMRVISWFILNCSVCGKYLSQYGGAHVSLFVLVVTGSSGLSISSYAGWALTHNPC